MLPSGGFSMNPETRQKLRDARDLLLTVEAWARTGEINFMARKMAWRGYHAAVKRFNEENRGIKCPEPS